MNKQRRICIRKMTLKDAPIVLIWENNPENWEVSNNNSIYSLCDIERLVDDLDDVKKAKQIRYIICLADTGLPIGTVDLFSINFQKNTADIGILIADKENRKKGYALISLQLLEEEAGALGIDYLHVEAHLDNQASCRLFETANYKKVLHPSSEVDNSAYIKTQLFEKCLKK